MKSVKLVGKFFCGALILLAQASYADPIEVNPNYDEAYRQALESGKMLFVYFTPIEETNGTKEFDATLADPEIEAAMSNYVVFKNTIEYVREGKVAPLVTSNAFEELDKQYGYAIIDLANKDQKSYKQVVSVYRFIHNGGPKADATKKRYKPFEPWAKETFKTILALPGFTKAEKTASLKKTELAKGTYLNTYVPNPDSVQLSQEEYEAIHYCNVERAKSGRWLLIVAKDLVTGSRGWAGHMRSSGGIFHASGWRENVAMGNYDGHATANQWIGSSGHYANIMSGSTYIGVGGSGNYWCQRFR